MTSIHLLATLLHHLHALVPALPPALRLNLALLMLALAQSPNCHLATLATVLPVEAQRENLIQRLRRWLSTRTLTGVTVTCGSYMGDWKSGGVERQGGFGDNWRYHPTNYHQENRNGTQHRGNCTPAAP